MGDQGDGLSALVEELAELLRVEGALLRLVEPAGDARLIGAGELSGGLMAAAAVAPMTLRDQSEARTLRQLESGDLLRAAHGRGDALGVAVRSSTGAFFGELWALSITQRAFSRADRRGLGLFAAEISRHLDRVRIVEDDSVLFGDSDARYAAIVEAMAEGVVVQTRDGRIIAANRAAEVILQMSGDELRGRTSLDPGWRAIREDGSPFPGTEHPAMVSLQTGQPLHGIIMGVRRGERPPTWISINSVPLFHHGDPAPVGVIASFSDITTLKRVEEELATSVGYFRRFFELSVDGIIIGHPNGRLLDANPAACALLRRSLSEMRALGRGGTVDPADPNIRRYLEIRAECGVVRGPLRLIRGDGTILHAEHAAMDFHVDDGDNFTVITFRDAEGERRFERAKRDFLAMVSHELRTPLTAIRGTLGLLAGGVLGDLKPEGVALVRAATDNAARLARLISDLLDSSSMDAGTFSIVASPFSLAALLDEVTATVEPLLGSAGVTLTRVRDDDDAAYGDRFRLQQVLVNLIGNAIKYSPPGATIEVDVHHREGGGLRVEVRDRGPGIPPEDQRRLFERFVQLDPSDSRRRGGAGLGLAISKAIVDAHGGRIAVDTREGGGSVFWFEIPGPPRELAVVE